MSRLSDPEMGPVVLTAPTPSPPKGPPRIHTDHLVLGFDVEWDGRADVKDSPLISAQFAGYTVGQDGKPKLVSKVYEPPGTRFTVTQLVEYVERFIREEGIPAPSSGKGGKVVHKVDLIAHLAQAEIGMIDHHFRDLVIQPVGNKAHHARASEIAVNGKVFRLQVIDLFAYFKVGLDKVGESVGLEKLNDGIDRARLAELKKSDRERFEQYAKRDAEIALLVFDEFRKQIFDDWNIDPLAKWTLPSIASEIFLRNYLTIEPVPSRDSTSVIDIPTKDGYQAIVRKERVYDGSADPRRQRRLDCCAAYHGAWAEAYVHGFWNAPVDEFDVTSLYPSAARLQALPNAVTNWFVITNAQRNLDDVEGFGWAKFAFPKDTPYPCLIVGAADSQRMVFPLKGETYCTIVELRRARKMGATLSAVRLHAFKPTQSEREHDVSRYMQEFMRRKSEEKKGTLRYDVVKLLLNALIGKFAERSTTDYLIREERLASRRGWDGFGRALATSIPLRGILRGKLRVGPLFIPEWATLILGLARALMADFVCKGALLVSTDSILVPKGTDIRCDSLDLLRSVGSDMTIEREADAVVIFRTRLYAMLRSVDNGGGLPEEKMPLASNDEWAVIKMARHGVPVDKKDCADAVLESLKAKRAVARSGKKTSLLGASAAIRRGLPMNYQDVVVHDVKFSWDNKRILLNRDVNPWRDFSKTSPFSSIGRLQEAERRKIAERDRRRQENRDLAKARHDHVVTLLSERCHSVREIASLTKVSKSTVQRLKESMRWSEMESYKQSKNVGPC